MLVLLGLYPMVCLEILGLIKRLAATRSDNRRWPCSRWNAITHPSVLMSPCRICPLLNWWLLPNPECAKSVHGKAHSVLLAVTALATFMSIFGKFMVNEHENKCPIKIQNLF